MKTYFRVDDDIYVEYDGDSRAARTLRKAEIRDEIAFLRAQLQALPEPLTNAELLAWAKANYPQSGHEQSRAQIQARINELQATLAELRA